MICVKFTAFCDLQVNPLGLKSVRKFWFCKLALTCVDLRVRFAKIKIKIKMIKMFISRK